MRCGPDHHTINFVRGKRTQMHHVAFELKDWSQVQSACDFLGSKNIPIIRVGAATAPVTISTRITAILMTR